jgi:hypothetical protein
MKKIPGPFIWFALAVAVLGGIFRLTGIYRVVEPRVFAATAMAMLIAAIAVYAAPKEQ